MSLRNMREHGVRSVLALCQEASCGHSGSINGDRLPDSFPVPYVSLRHREARYSITSSAWARSSAGISIPSAFAVFRFRMRTKVVDW
jgi:hypothetical protein